MEHPSHTCKWHNKLLCFTLFHKHMAKPALCNSCSAKLFAGSNNQVLSELFMQGATVTLPAAMSARAFGRFQSSWPLQASSGMFTHFKSPLPDVADASVRLR